LEEAACAIEHIVAPFAPSLSIATGTNLKPEGVVLAASDLLSAPSMKTCKYLG
jgi:hypothetical protein